MTPSDGRRARTSARVVLAAVMVGLVCFGAAMVRYPGGNPIDRQAVGYSFWRNFLCDLTEGVALNGADNSVSVTLARAAMLVFAVALAAFSWMMAEQIAVVSRLAPAMRVLGTASGAGVATVPFTFGSIHAVAVFAAAIPGLATMAMAFMTTARMQQRRLLLGLQAATFAAAATDAVLYAHSLSTQPRVILPALPAVQRLAFLLLVAWMITASIRMLGSAAPVPVRPERP